MRRRGWSRDIRLALCLTFGCLIGGVPGNRAFGAEPAVLLSDDIPAQALAPALNAFAERSGLQLIYLSELARDRVTHGARRGMSLADALTQLLAGTGLEYEYLDARTVRIFAASHDRPADRSGAAVTTANPPSVRGARVPSTNTDVVVTAARRDELQRKVPLSLANWTAESLDAASIHDLPSLAALTPGVEVDAYYTVGPGIETNISIRGINAKDGSTTGVYVDDVPIPTDRGSVFGRAFPFPLDLDHIEVLRGPQGITAGEGSEGGLVRFVTKQPDLGAYDGTARAEAALTAYGAPSYSASVAAGGPVIPQELGIRVAASSAHLGGYIDRVSPFNGATVEPNANFEKRDTLRVAALFVPVGILSVSPAFYYQASTLNDTPSFYTYLSDPGQGILRNGRLVRQWAVDRLYVASLNVHAALPLGELAVTTGYVDRLAQALEDITNWPAYQWPNPLGPEYPVSWSNAKVQPVELAQHVLSEDVRLKSHDTGLSTSWLAGASYLRGHYSETQGIADALFADGGNTVGEVFDRRTVEILGFFAEISKRLAPRVTASTGLRFERSEYVVDEHFHDVTQAHSRSTKATTQSLPRLSISFEAGPHDLYYLNLSKGYRMGGANSEQGTECPTPPPTTYGPDSVWSVELGMRGGDGSDRVRFEASAFYSRWDSMQTEVSNLTCGVGYVTNAGGATSRGVDLGVSMQPTLNLRTSLTVAYVDAHYTQTVTSGSAVVVGRGDAIGALPLVPAPWSLTAAGDYQVNAPAEIAVSIHVQNVYHSRNPGPFTSDNPAALVYAPSRTANPPSDQLDVRVTASRGSVDVATFVNNLLNRLPVLDRRNWTPGDTLFVATTFRPRTTGVAIRWHF
jgi:outer membrane receptor protein involved in Fe transport